MSKLSRFFFYSCLADDQSCEYVPSALMYSSKWCGVELKNLVDENYEPIQKTLCLEERVANEVFNATCSREPFIPTRVFTPFRIVSIVTGIIILIILIFALLCLVRFCTKQKFRRLRKDGKEDEENRDHLFPI